MENQDYYAERVEYAEKRALENTAVDQVEVFLGANNLLTLRSAVGMILESKLIQDAGIGIRLITKDNCMGFSSTCDLDDKTIGNTIEEAIKLAKYRQIPTNYTFTTPQEATRSNTFYDQNLVDEIYNYEHLNSLVNQMLDDTLESDSKITEASGPVHLVEYYKHLKNSEGVNISEGGTYWKAELFAIAESGQERREGSNATAGWQLSDFNSEKLVSHASKMAVDSLGGTDIEAGKYEMIFSSGSMATFLGWFTMLTLPQFQEKNMPLLRDKLGEEVISPLCTIANDPLTIPSPISGAYDDEGVPTTKTTLVEKGVLKEIPVDNYYATKLDTTSNGNGYRVSRGSGTTNYPGQLYQSEPFPALPAVFMSSGDSSEEEMIAETKNGIFLDFLHYAYITNGSVGDYTGILRQGTFLIKNGKIVSPIKKCRLIDNIINIGKGIELVGKSRITGHWDNRMKTPPVKIKEVSLIPY
ncbi:MAG: TldD/PmbA family protein [Candidatus Hodarchaeales archaeon]|jgi:PmbA protein